jgi:hypothetical protein
MGSTIQVGPVTIYGPKEGQLHGPSTGSIDSPKGSGRMIHRMVEPSPSGSNPQRAHKDIEIPRYPEHVSGTLRPTFRIHCNPMFRNVGTHDPDAWRHAIWTCESPRLRCRKCPWFWRAEVPDPGNGRPLEDKLSPFPGETDHHPYYKYLQTFMYTLVDIIQIKALTHSSRWLLYKHCRINQIKRGFMTKWPLIIK